MMARGRDARQVLHRVVALLALLPLLTGCTLSGGTRYLPANAADDPYRTVRARAQEFYQAGVERERQGDWRQALDDYQQARLWDPDNRQDIKDAVGRMQARVGATAPRLKPPAQADGARPQVTPTAPSAGMRTFESTSFPYGISYPEDWLAKPDGTSEQPIDTFLGQPAPNVAAMVMITVEPIESSATLDELSAVITRELHASGVHDVRLAERRLVSGLPAYLLTYHVTAGAETGSRRHVLFLTPGRAWHVVLLAAPGTTPDLLKTFDAMLDSIELQSPAFPHL